MTGSRAGARQRLVPAVPQPLDRHGRCSAPTATLYASAGDGASFNNVDYGQNGATYAGDQATRAAIRPAAWRRADPAERRGRRAARQERADVRTTRRRSTARSCASIPPPARACPTTRSPPRRTPTRGASWPTGCATRSASPCARAPTSCGSATSAGTPGRRSTASSSPTSATACELRLALLRGASPQSGYQGAGLSMLLRPCIRRLARSSHRTTPTTTAPAS